MGYTMPCCSHGDKGEDVKGYDCISIPGAQKTDGSDIKVSKVCGHKAGLVTMNAVPSAMGDAMGHKTICSEYMQQLSILIRYSPTNRVVSFQMGGLPFRSDLQVITGSRQKKWATEKLRTQRFKKVSNSPTNCKHALKIELMFVDYFYHKYSLWLHSSPKFL